MPSILTHPLPTPRCIAQIIYLFLGLSKVVWAGDVQNYVNSFDDGDGNLGWYPTGFTRDVIPVCFIVHCNKMKVVY